MANSAASSVYGSIDRLCGGFARCEMGSPAPKNTMPMAMPAVSAMAKRRHFVSIGLASGPPMTHRPHGRKKTPIVTTSIRSAPMQNADPNVSRTQQYDSAVQNSNVFLSAKLSPTAANSSKNGG